jgi:N-methylhydantoinase B
MTAAIDDFTYEVLRHRLLSDTLEGAAALQRVSGSPLATEAFDMNTSIMSAAGEVAFVGPYLLTGPMSQGLIVRNILERPVDGIAVEPGDVYLCNDPYSGAAHQNCVTLVGPIHAGDRLIAWAGATLHVVDVGGKHVGQVGIGASSILDEAPAIPPIRIARRGQIVEEAERSYIERSRTPELNALDLRAKLAAVSTVRARVAEVVRSHGADAVAETIERTIADGASHLRRRLMELPDGSASHIAILDRSDAGGAEIYEVRLRIDKHGDRLVLDFAGSSEQAPAVVNCTRSGLMSGVLIGVLTSLVWDAPWCPGAIERVIEVRSEPGTVIDAAWPAGCSMATMAAGFAVTTATQIGLAELLARSRRDAERAMAGWAGAVGSVDVFGRDGTGRPFGTVLLDSMACGTGATALSDGIDCGGFLRSIGCVVANVEQYEARFPVLYLWRRREPDSGGAGRRRGGAGVGYAVTPRGVQRIDTVSPHFSGTLEPESAGLLGGYPGAVNRVVLHQAAGVSASFADGRVPADASDLGGAAEILPGVARMALNADDVLEIATSGGGGWGDAIEREPERVADDVRARVVSVTRARATFGVELDADGEPDPTATDARRAAILRQRSARLGSPAPADRPQHEHESPDRAPRPPVAGWPAVSEPLTHSGPGVRFPIEERYCPDCLALVSVERQVVEAEEATR